jgi:hypothetical protein
VRLAFSAIATTSLFLSSTMRAGSPIEVKVTAAMREYCHIVQFSQGWVVAQFDGRGQYLGNFLRDYEFRVTGELRTRFLVAGVVDAGFEQQRRYTTNKYEVNLSDPKALVRSASDEAWQSAATVPTARKRVFVASSLLTDDKAIEFHNFLFTKFGDHWALDNSLLSPDQAWLVLQSWTGTAEVPSEHGITFDWGTIFGYRGKLFFDVFNADNGKKLLTIQGRYATGNPGGVIGRTAWLTERYFIVPMGEHSERCLVCDFGRSVRKQAGKP